MTRPRDYKSGEIVPGTVYRVVRLIGAGGMGTVYDVEDTTVGKRYVLKTLHPELHKRQDLAQRMVKEARQLARLQHPNIVEVVTAGETTDDLKLPFYVMEKLNGQSLHTVLQKKGSLELAHALHIAIDLLDALDNAHDKGVVHRDVKPDNIFLHINPNGQTTTKLLDFGIMRVLDEPGVTAGRFMGTLRYAAPEQLRGEPTMPRTDLYAAGLVLYEMVAGRGPFDNLGDSNKVAAGHLSSAAPPMSHWGAIVPESLEALVASVLAKDPQQRPKDAFTFASQLRTLNRILAAERPKGSATSRPTEVPVVVPEVAAPSSPSLPVTAHVATGDGPASPAPVASAIALAATEHAATRAGTPEAKAPPSYGGTDATGSTASTAPPSTTRVSQPRMAAPGSAATATGSPEPPTERGMPLVDRSAATHTASAATDPRLARGPASPQDGATEPVPSGNASPRSTDGGWRAPATLRMSDAPPRRLDEDRSSDLLARLPTGEKAVAVTDGAASATVAPATGRKVRPALGVAVGIALTLAMAGTVTIGALRIRSRFTAAEPLATAASDVPSPPPPAPADPPATAPPPAATAATAAAAAPTIAPPLDLPLPSASASANPAPAAAASDPAVSPAPMPAAAVSVDHRRTTPGARVAGPIPSAPAVQAAKRRPSSGL